MFSALISPLFALLVIGSLAASLPINGDEPVLKPLEFGLWVGNALNDRPKYVGKYVSPVPVTSQDGTYTTPQEFTLVVYLDLIANHTLPAGSNSSAPVSVANTRQLGRPLTIVDDQLVYDGAWPMSCFSKTGDLSGPKPGDRDLVAAYCGSSWEARFHPPGLTEDSHRPKMMGLNETGLDGAYFLEGRFDSRFPDTWALNWFACDEVYSLNFSTAYSLETWNVQRVRWTDLELANCQKIDIFALDYWHCHEWDPACRP